MNSYRRFDPEEAKKNLEKNLCKFIKMQRNNIFSLFIRREEKSDRG